MNQMHNPTELEPRTVRGFKICAGHLSKGEQESMIREIRGVAAKAPMYSPMTPYGRRMSVRTTPAGKYGWHSDRKGYRYESGHPSGVSWPPIPASVLRVWREVTGLEREPECCLINFYGEGARMGMHRDCDEANFDWPVVSISLGDDALFRIGNLQRGGRTESVWLHSGDVVVMGGSARLAYHGVDRIKFGTSDLLRDGGRINLTLRVVD